MPVLLDTNGALTLTVNGSACLFCGAQALAMADIGLPQIVEDTLTMVTKMVSPLVKSLVLRSLSSTATTMVALKTLVSLDWMLHTKYVFVGGSF